MGDLKKAAADAQEAMQKTLQSAQRSSLAMQEGMKRTVAVAQEKLAEMLEETKKAFEKAHSQAKEKMEELQSTLEETREKLSEEQQQQLQQIEEMLQGVREDLRAGTAIGLEAARAELQAIKEQLHEEPDLATDQWKEAVVRAAGSTLQLIERVQADALQQEERNKQGSEEIPEEIKKKGACDCSKAK